MTWGTVATNLKITADNFLQVSFLATEFFLFLWWFTIAPYVLTNQNCTRSSPTKRVYVHCLHAGYFDCGCIHWLVEWGWGHPHPSEGESPPPSHLTGSSQQIKGLCKKWLLSTFWRCVISWLHEYSALLDYTSKRVEILQINEIEALVQGGQGPLGRASAASRSLTLSFCPKKFALKFWILNCGFKIFTLEFWPRNFVGWVPGAGPVQPVVDPELHPASIAASTG